MMGIIYTYSECILFNMSVTKYHPVYINNIHISHKNNYCDILTWVPPINFIIYRIRM